MIIIFWSICLIVSVLLVWFNSDALIEWGHLFGLDFLLKTKEFHDYKLEMLPSNINYPTFLKIKYNTFITKLLACPICLTFWISFALCIFSSLLLLPFIYIGSLSIYGVIINLLKLI